MDLKRYEGFSKALSESDIMPELMIIPMQRDERMAFYRMQKNTFCRYTAIFAMSDVYAVELMQFLQSEGFRIPSDIAIAGFDDAPIASVVCPILTTIRQDLAECARRAINILLGLKKKEEKPAHVVLPVELVVRESTEP